MKPCGLALALILWPDSPRAAQSHPAVTPPPFRRQSEQPAGLTPAIDGLLRKLVATYRNADSYRDQGRVTLVQQTGRVKTTTEMPLEIAFQRPNRLRLDAGHYLVACDGQTLFTTIVALRQFTATPAPTTLEKKHLAGGPAGGGSEEGHPDVLDFLIRPEVRETWMAQLTKIGSKPDLRIADKTCRVLYYETIQGTRVTLYLDAQSMLVRRVEAQTGAGEVGGSTSFTYELEDATLNPRLDQASFAFRPPPGFRQVQELHGGTDPLVDPAHGGSQARDPDGPEAAVHLLGKPAPPVSGKDLAGRPVASTDLQGRVVLLFFWSLAGGEHCLRSIPIVQEVAERFRDRPEVLVLGVSPDVDKVAVVGQLLERKQARFRTLLDEGMRMQIGFGLGGVPTFVVIGSHGKVTWARLGAPPTLKAELVGELERLLPTPGK